MAEDIWEMRGESGHDELKLALSLVNLNTKIDVDIDSLYLGHPIFDDKMITKKYNDKVLLELQRLREEF